MPGDKIKATKKKKEKNTVFYSFQDKESVYFNGLQLKAGLKIPYKFILTNTPVKQDPSKRTRNVEELVAEGRRLQKLGSNENLIPHLEGLAAISFPVADSAVVTENATADVEPEQGSSKRKRPEKSNSGEPLDHDEEDIEVEGRPSKILNTRSGEESSESIEHVSSNEIIQQNGEPIILSSLPGKIP
ncbi:expressed protein [Phakopsora pachyrhizi]|uniref:Expressed protein n=1 Tax=Phakopsora pachyrhizi TaxID=170000 RepID=A0AAV0BP13_PHAPC|nr:expressed protein [Phakopsora pachyrhizi]CAH7688388.1 expressed protein [Phakopsora pachyrhizi]